MKPVVAIILAASVGGCLTTADFGVENGQTVSQSEIRVIVAEMRRQIARCWAPPAGTGVPTLRVYFELNQDGTLARDPVVLPVSSGDLQNPQLQPTAKSALRAVRACTPLRLPADRYKIWEKVEVTFDPRTVRER